jgi:hypothetical protein
VVKIGTPAIRTLNMIRYYKVNEMKNFLLRILPVMALIMVLYSSSCFAQTGSAARKYGKGTITRSGFNKKAPAAKQTKVKEPKAVIKAKKQQEKNERKLKKENDKAISAAKSRHFSIQSADVQERMKQNEKDNVLRDKSRKKNIRKASRPAARRYKK